MKRTGRCNNSDLGQRKYLDLNQPCRLLQYFQLSFQCGLTKSRLFGHKVVPGLVQDWIVNVLVDKLFFTILYCVYG